MTFPIANTGFFSSSKPFVPPVNDNTDDYLKLETHKLGTMLQERFLGGAAPITRVTSLSQNVGTIYDMSLNANVLSTFGGVPTIETFSTLNSALFFGGSADPIAYDSNTAFKFLHATNPIYSIQFKAGLPSGSNGILKVLMTTNNRGNSASAGLTIERSVGNQIAIRVSNGTTNIIVFTHSSTVNEATGVASIQLNINGVGTGTGMMRVNGVEETFDVGAGSTTNSLRDFLFGGASQTVGNGLYQADLTIKNRILTSGELTAFESYFPAVDASDFAPIPQWILDIEATDKIWADTGKTTPITDGTAVRVIESNTQTLEGVTRELTSSAVGTSPVFESAFQNGQNVLTWDGVDDNLDFSENMMYELGGIYTLFVVAKNEDSTFGSHIFSGGNDYLVITGEDYSGAFDVPYMAYHSSFPAAAQAIEGTSTTDAVEVFVVKRNGQIVTVFNGNGESETNSTITDPYEAEDMGKNSANRTADWWFDGFLCYAAKYNGLISNEQIQARIIELRNQFGT